MSEKSDLIWAKPIADAYQIADKSARRAACTVLKIEHVTPNSASTRATVPSASKRFVKMPVYDDAAAAGIPVYAESDFQLLTFDETSIPSGTDFGIRISGDSMEPTITDGQIVWIHRQPDIADGQVGVFMLEGGYAVCKRARCSARGRITALESDNEKYSPIKDGGLDGLRLVGRVLIE